MAASEAPDLNASALDHLGPQLLGAGYHHQENTDWRMGEFLAADDPLEAAFQALLKSHAAPATKTWVTAAMDRLRGLSPVTPQPQPQPANGVKVWNVDRWFDQRRTGHCTGFSGIGWGRCDPINDDFTDADGHALYYEEKVLDGEPGAEDGSSIHTLAKALVNRRRLASYAWGRTIEELDEWLLTRGPVVLGTNWYQSMFNPDAQGFVTLGGGIAGGHAFYARGRDKSGSKPFTIIRNSWSKGWGKDGDFLVYDADLKRLLDEDGEAMVGLELALVA